MTAVVKGFASASADADAAAFCDLLSTSARAALMQEVNSSEASPELKGLSCAARFRKSFAAASTAGTLDQLRHVRVSAVKIDGDHATATMTFAGTQPSPVALVREHDGEWKLDIGAPTG